jgi:hypothetical protein
MAMSAQAQAVARQLDTAGAPARFADATLSLVGSPDQEGDHAAA